ncbi:MAG: hypothetical protein ACREPR_13465 [Brasilonema sp.]
MPTYSVAVVPDAATVDLRIILPLVVKGAINHFMIQQQFLSGGTPTQ